MLNDNTIEIDVSTNFVDDQSDPDDDRYVFAYTITIANRGSVAAKLMSRHWVITDGNGKVQEVSGDGVVGEQPHLNPGEQFRYSSGAVLETPVDHLAVHRNGYRRGSTRDRLCFMVIMLLLLLILVSRCMVLGWMLCRRRSMMNILRLWLMVL